MTPRVRLLVNGLLVLAPIGAGCLVVLGSREMATAAVWGRLLIGVGVGGAIAVGVMFFLPLELRANLTLTGLAVLLTLWAASWILYERQLTPWEIRLRDAAAAAKDAGVPFDTRTPTRVIKDLRERGVDAAPTLSATTVLFRPRSETQAKPAEGLFGADSAHQLVPLAGRAATTTVACNEFGDYLIVDTDRYGFNNPDQVYTATSPILILGDSFAFGYCVPAGHDISSQLRDRAVEVVNLGYPATGPLIQLAQLREYGAIIKPSAVLWLYYHGNDLTNLGEEYAEPALRRYLDIQYRQDLPTRQPEIDAFWTEYIERVVLPSSSPTRPRLRDILLLRPLRERLIPRTPSPSGRVASKAPIERFEESLDAILAQTRTLNASLYFVFLPTYAQFVENDAKTSLEHDRDAVLTAVASRDLPIIDFGMRLRETRDPLQFFPFRKPGHYTEAAYNLLAEQILGHLRQDGLLVTGSTTP